MRSPGRFCVIPLWDHGGYEQAARDREERDVVGGVLPPLPRRHHRREAVGIMALAERSDLSALHQRQHRHSAGAPSDAVPLPNMPQTLLGDESHCDARVEAGSADMAAWSVLDCVESEGPLVGAARRRSGHLPEVGLACRSPVAASVGGRVAARLRGTGRSGRDLHQRQRAQQARQPQTARRARTRRQDWRDRREGPIIRQRGRCAGPRSHDSHCNGDGVGHHQGRSGGLHRWQPRSTTR